MDLNRVFLYGNLTRDPETRHTQSGAQVTTFSLAVNERRSGKEETMFIKIDTWNKTAELCAQYLKKGSAVLVEGRLKIEEYETKDGQKRRDPAVVADRISFGPKSTGAGGGERSDYGSREPQQRSNVREYDNPPLRNDDYSDAPADARSGGGDTEDDLPF